MRTCVTCCTNTCIGGFIRLAEKFYSLPFKIDYVPKSVTKSDQLIQLCDNMTDDYFILLEDDFYLVSPVDISLLHKVFDFCTVHGVDRFSLQTKNAHMVSTWTQTEKTIADNPVYRTNPAICYPFSLEASIWKRDFLRSQLIPGMSEPQIEIQVSKQIREANYFICALDKTIMHYMDASRDGRQMIQVANDPLQLTVQL